MSEGEIRRRSSGLQAARAYRMVAREMGKGRCSGMATEVRGGRRAG
jgi:hypothetical protein